MTVSTVFLLLLIYTIGSAWASLPRASTVQDTRFSFLGPVIHFINPGPFGLKEVSHVSKAGAHLPRYSDSRQHVVASLIASTAASGSTAVMNFAVQRVQFSDF